ncbi:4-(cytidine 5'-diphospho)-2-C-methyl-D-erythritol kinase [Prochlorococcus sp. MIT 1223]|uniref:4-(cytidine 5'-diphospho)-2-C-methyl-D-erythritol kinase n=1 Tax=Prochlorococcus sp. MIT 1223 TaxID=3096217 RepID=UPI002A751FE6|nr:4-(cytidine 5'-diphospho)-2-C-methyl-D-erythritol kinase [Prochlorococcus sp. MIT 1223]
MIYTSSNKTIRVNSPAKINLHLQILGIRADGYHELAMVMQSIDLSDEITLTLNNNGIIKLSSDSPNLSDGDDNLIVRSAKLLKHYAKRPDLGVDISLRKRIPIGAGLAGGSSNAASTFIGLNNLWKLGYSTNDLEKISSELGSDIPFCISGGTQLCFGRGELLEQIPSISNKMSIILLKDPLVNVSTPWAYKLHKEKFQIEYLSSEEKYEDQRINLRSAVWLSSNNQELSPPLRNDLQKTISPLVPSVENALTLLRSIPTSLSVAMSGSGPSCFALFEDLDTAKNALHANSHNFKAAGFESWCCSLVNKGPCIEK